jgi:hypothetical protein
MPYESVGMEFVELECVCGEVLFTFFFSGGCDSFLIDQPIHTSHLPFTGRAVLERSCARMPAYSFLDILTYL